MPDWTYNNIIHYIEPSARGDIWPPNNPTAAQIQQEFEEWQQECLRQDFAMEQMMHEEEERIRQEEELKEDKRKYPLFFLEEGIV